MKHCCEQMDFFLEEDKVAITYTDKFRGYSINLKYTSGMQQINFCPWCGTKLPENLRDKWFDTLLDEYGIEDPFDEIHKVPKEFKSDKWWINRIKN